MPAMDRVKNPSAKPTRSRREKAQATRRRIIEAARSRFETEGYASTTMDTIAADAGVAVQTVYFAFHTKAEVLLAVMTVAGGEAGDPEGDCDAGVSDVAGADMFCKAERCVIDCAAGGDALCREVDEDLVCNEAAGSICVEACRADGSCRDEEMRCFDKDRVCLPLGSFPGGACREVGDVDGECDAGVSDVAGADTHNPALLLED